MTDSVRDGIVDHVYALRRAAAADACRVAAGGKWRSSPAAIRREQRRYDHRYRARGEP